MISETTQTPVYPDAYIEEFGDRYVQLRLDLYGIPFLSYLAHPAAFANLERDLARPETAPIDPDAAAADFLPLLAEQRAVQARIDAEAEAESAEREAERDCPDLICRGGQLVEPMHHHAHIPRSARAHFRGKGGSHE